MGLRTIARVAYWTFAIPFALLILAMNILPDGRASEIAGWTACGLGAIAACIFFIFRPYRRI